MRVYVENSLGQYYRFKYIQKMTFDRFMLRQSPRWITIDPADAAVSPSEVLFIDRATCKASVRDRLDVAGLAEPESVRVVFGLVGLVNSLVDKYLIVVEQRAPAGVLLEEPVWRVRKLSAIPVRGAKMLKKMTHITKQQRDEEAILHKMLLDALALPGFYFSHGIDLTRSAQFRSSRSERTDSTPLVAMFARANMTFVWNRFAAKPLADLGLVAWLVPLILGYVDVRDAMVNGKSITLALIARRAADRPGLRFTARGADIHGNASNHVETEQIVAHGNAFASYVLVRGSIPLLWKQEACIRYKPKPTLKYVDDGGKGGLSQQAFERHFSKLIATHGPITAVSLIDTRGAEAKLGDAYAAAADLSEESQLRYVSWDFHAKTKGMKYENVDLDLMPSLDADQKKYGYYLCDEKGTEVKRQVGAFRINCIDSLDRTNVVQCVIAHRVLDDALAVLGVLNSEYDSAAKFPSFERQFKATWADHADAIAVVYSGSGALKTDYTRTGKRTKPGIAQDGVRSARRYVYQNFWDGRRQDGIDLFLGVVTVDSAKERKETEAERSFGPSQTKSVFPLTEPTSLTVRFLPHALGVFLSVAAVGIAAPQRFVVKMLMTVGGLTGAAATFSRILQVGRELVAKPRFHGTN